MAPGPFWPDDRMVGTEHLPALQPPPSHTTPQRPQLFGSVWRSTHAPPHVVAGQVHTPLLHAGVLPEQVCTAFCTMRSGPHSTMVLALAQTACPGWAFAHAESMGAQVP